MYEMWEHFKTHPSLDGSQFVLNFPVGKVWINIGLDGGMMAMVRSREDANTWVVHMNAWAAGGLSPALGTMRTPAFQKNLSATTLQFVDTPQYEALIRKWAEM